MDEKKLNPEIEAILEKDKENKEKLAEIYSQCWDDEAFKARFMADPKAVMDEYGVLYDDDKDYLVVECNERTVTFILPYEHIKETMEQLGDVFKDTVKDVVEFRQIIPAGWNLSFIQNTEDVNYLVLPVSPENLTPEELEYVSGGGFFFATDVFIAYSSAIVAYQSFLVALSVVAAVNAIAVLLATIAFVLASAVVSVLP